MKADNRPKRVAQKSGNLRRPVASLQTAWQRLDELSHKVEQTLAVQDQTQGVVDDLRTFLAWSDYNRRPLPPYEERILRLRALVRQHVPRGATLLVMADGDHKLTDFSNRTGWHFPRNAAGEYLEPSPAGDLAVIAQLEAWRAQGAGFFVMPGNRLHWLDQYPLFRRHLEDRYRIVAQASDTAVIWSLTERPHADSKSLVLRFAEVVAEFKSRYERDPVVLDWHVGVELDKQFPRLTIFKSPSAHGPLPYLDGTTDFVVTTSSDALALSEARRVASAAVVLLDKANQKLTVKWLASKWDHAFSVSIVMPCYDGHLMTDGCLRSLLETLPPHLDCEVIAVDDASRDGTAAMLKRWANRDARVKVVRNKRNIGFVDSCNHGARKATGDVLVFMNNDLALLPGWIEPLLRVFRDRADAGVCGGKLIFPDGTLQEAGGVVFRDGSAMNFGRGDTDLDDLHYNFLREVDYCSGALFATRRELFTRLGGFGVEYRPGYYEDTDYCFKVREAGLRVYFQPESVVVHREGGTAGTDLKVGMKSFQAINQEKFRKRWAEALKSQPEHPGALNKVTLCKLAWRGQRRALVVSPYPPEFDRDSGSKRVLDLIELLLADGWSVTFLASNRMGEERYVRTLRQMGVVVFDGAKVKAEEFFAAMKFDLALLAFWSVAEIYVPQLRKASPRTRIIVDSVDLNLVRVARGMFREAADKRRMGALEGSYGSDAMRELNAYAAADAVLAVSRKEASLVDDFIAQPGLARAVADMERVVDAPAPLSERRGIVFMGSFRHTPNIGAVEFLCKEVVPRLDPALIARHPIYILGEGLDDSIRKFADGLPQVRMVGWVPNVLPYLKHARLSVVPLRFGAGTKRKLLQTLVAGTPAVSTTVGVEGFNLTDGEHILIADEGKPFANQIARLLTDDALWQRLLTNGRTRMLAQHGRDVVRTQLREIIAKVLAAPAKPGRELADVAAGALAGPARMDKQQYGELVGNIRKVAERCLPKHAKVIVVSKGDDELLQLADCTGWHFPQDEHGAFAGYYPKDSAAAIAQLETLREKGGEFLVLPITSLWWLEHYQDLRRHLAEKYSELVRDERTCVIFDLRDRDTTAKVTVVETGLADHVGRPSDVRLIAFYLPQFHPIPENDAWWGEGFTEWTNVGRAKPLFDGHYQPHIPADLGSYDLRSAETRAAQAELARAHGIHGFCYYHYWFNGKRLLERPFNEVLARGEPDFPFCLCWANEPWSRRWDGRPEDVLQAQTYSAEDDVNHIRWLLPALADKRAIQIEGKPVFIVYQGRDLPDPARTVETWRREVAAAGLPGVYLLSVETGRDAGWDATQVGFDAKILFAPQFTTLFTSGAQISVPGKDKLRVFDYEKAWPVLANPKPVTYRRYDTVFPSWDNSPRTGDDAVILHNSSPAAYEHWLGQAVAKARLQSPEHQIVFLNAWNEWGEGCHLEPDIKFGRAYLEATRRVIVESASATRLAPSDDRAAQQLQGPRSTMESRTLNNDVLSSAVQTGLTSSLDTHKALYMAMFNTACGKRDSEFVPLAEADRAMKHDTLKPIAFYLPQFHPIPENDKWWGKGFTEWTNVSKATPQFVGHYQPHLPGELGFYDLRVPDVQRRQVELAKLYGLHGFCFYYYWFSGRRLLERPLDQFMSDPAIDFPFCVCWANENWTRRWDGEEDDILLAQNHSDENDLAFIRDLESVLRHRNYIRLHGRPVLLVYRVRLLPNPAETAKRWRKHCDEVGIPNPYLVVAQTFERIDPTEIGFDAAVEFPPNTPGNRPELSREVQLLNSNYAGKIYRYTDLIRFTVRHPRPTYDLFRTVCPSWDNEARSPGRGSVYAGSSPKAYGGWLREACQLTLKDPDPAKHFVFINAWNEWAEGTHLEPDRRYGYAYLQTTANVLSSLSPDAYACPDWSILFISHDANLGGAQLVLLNQMAWIKKHTTLRLKILCLEGGNWLGRFQEIADTITLPELQQRAAVNCDKDIMNELLDFCDGKPDLIYGNSVASGRIYSELARLEVPIVTHFHELEMSIKRYASNWIDDIVEYSSHHIACSDAVSDSLIKNYSISATEVSTVFASIRLDGNVRSISAIERASLRRSLGLPANRHLVFGCGLGMPFRKGADLFIKIGRQLRAMTNQDFRFYWIGEFDVRESDPKYGAWADHLAQLNGEYADYIKFLGPKDNPRQYLQVADVFLLPSREDPFPLVALEAAECGVPIVCFDKAGGMPTFVGKDAGIVSRFGNVRAMAKAVKALIENEDYKCRLGERARGKVRSRFTVEFTAPQILSVCRSVANKRPALSVIVPNFNHARYLPERLDSIFSQTYKDFEVILLDDASSDNSMEVLQQYRDYFDVRIVRNDKNSGSTFKQWLKGIELTRADIIWIAESDDRCDPDFVASLLPAFKNPRVKLAYANSHVMDEQGAVVGEYTNSEYLTALSPTKWTENYCVPADQEINDGLGVKNTILSASAVMFRKFNPSQEVRTVLESMRLAGDWYFIIQAIVGGEVFYTSRKLNYHRRHSESVIGKLLKQNRVNDFYNEFYTVQNVIFSKYRLNDGFHGKWERYLRDQWKAFFPDRPFEELAEYYPFAEASEQILSAVAHGVSDLSLVGTLKD